MPRQITSGPAPRASALGMPGSSFTTYESLRNYFTESVVILNMYLRPARSECKPVCVVVACVDRLVCPLLWPWNIFVDSWNLSMATVVRDRARNRIAHNEGRSIAITHYPEIGDLTEPTKTLLDGVAAALTQAKSTCRWPSKTTACCIDTFRH